MTGRMPDDVVRVVQIEVDPTCRTDSGTRFRIELEHPTAPALSTRIGWWKSLKRAEAEAEDLRRWLRDRGLM